MSKNMTIAAVFALTATLVVYMNEKRKDRLQADCHVYMQTVTRIHMEYASSQNPAVIEMRRLFASSMNMGESHRDYCRF